jgi:hypothetical protein
MSTETKPRVKLTGTDGNVFALSGLVMRALRKANQPEKADEFSKKLFQCGSYDEALALMSEYCEVS